MMSRKRSGDGNDSESPAKYEHSGSRHDDLKFETAEQHVQNKATVCRAAQQAAVVLLSIISTFHCTFIK